MKPPYLRLRIESPSPGRPIKTSEIVNSIQKEITSNVNTQGCRLPPVRVLAHQFGISKNVVHAAYEELISRDLVINKERQGFFVLEKKLIENPAPVTEVGTTAFNDPPHYEYFTSRELINLSIIYIDPELVSTKKITDCFRSVLTQPVFHDIYEIQGYFPLRDAIAQRLKNQGIPAHPDHILITSGSQQALDIVCRAIRGNHIALENPTYFIGKRLIEMNRCRITGLPLDPFNGVDIDRWENILSENKPDLLYLTSSFHNPTGYSYTTKEFQEILSLSNKYDFGILEDDWGADMLSFSEYKPALRALGGKNVLYMNTFTKKIDPSLRIGYLLGNEKNIRALIDAKSISTLGNPKLIEAAVFEFLDRGYYDSHLKTLQTELDKRYTNCINVLRGLMPKEVKWTSPGGGPFLWLEFPKQINLRKLQDSVLKRKVIIMNYDQAFFENPHLHGCLIGYSNIKEESLNRGIEILSEEIRKVI